MTSQWLEIVLVVPIPLIVTAINGSDFLIRTKARRGSFLYFDQKTLKNYLVVHWLLVVTVILWGIGRFTSSVSSAYQICSAGWLVYINIYAMIRRRKKFTNRTLIET